MLEMIWTAIFKPGEKRGEERIYQCILFACSCVISLSFSFSIFLMCRYMSGLVQPPTVQGRVLNADVCILANNVRNLVSTESADDWFDAFQSAAVKWPDLDTYLMEKYTGKASANKSAGSKKRLSSGLLGTGEEEGMSEKKKKLSLMAQYFGVAPKLVEELCEPGNVLRLRFARAVSELEKAGLIKCSKSEKSPDSILISRQLFTWI